jgi:hypothetical protein
MTGKAKPPKAKIGRPNTGRTERVLLSMTAGELEEIDEAARSASLDRSSFVRTTVLQAIRSKKP